MPTLPINFEHPIVGDRMGEYDSKPYYLSTDQINMKAKAGLAPTVICDYVIDEAVRPCADGKQVVMIIDGNWRQWGEREKRGDVDIEPDIIRRTMLCPLSNDPDKNAREAEHSVRMPTCYRKAAEWLIRKEVLIFTRGSQQTTS